MKLPRRIFLHLTAGAAAVPIVSRIARGQAYPARPVRIIVGYSAGGIVDVLARMIGQSLSERLGQQFFVENRLGAAAKQQRPSLEPHPTDILCSSSIPRMRSAGPSITI